MSDHSAKTVVPRKGIADAGVRGLLLWVPTVLLLSGCACCLRPASLGSPPPLAIPSDAIIPTDSNSTGALAAGRFAVSSDGAATFSYPLWTPQGRRGVQPDLALSYSSRNTNGLAGTGWTLQGLSSISRCKRDMAHDGFNAAIQFDTTDALCLDGQRLVAFPGVQSGTTGTYGAQGAEYRTEQESFSLIINGPTDDKGPLQFEVRLKDGRIFFYGSTADSRLEGQRFQSTPQSLGGTQIQTNLNQTVRLSWSLSEVRDRYGNNLTIQYLVAGDPASQQGYEQLPQTIRYTGTVDNSLSPQRQVAFQYESRPDPQTVFVSGLRLQLRDRLTRIVLSAPNPTDVTTVKSYQLNYLTSKATQRTLLSEILECDAASVCLAPTAFSYSFVAPDWFDDIDTGIHDDTAVGESSPSVGAQLGAVTAGDINGDGCDDLIYSVYPGSVPVTASYALSSCYDAMAAGKRAFPAPNPAFLFQLSPAQAGAPDSDVPSVVFSPPAMRPAGGPPAACFSPTGAEVWACYNEWLTADLDLDGRADLLAYFVLEDCGHPFPSGCDISTTWDQTFTLSSLLASSVPPATWSPTSGLFGAEIQTSLMTTSGKSVFSLTPPNSFYFTSVYVGDINGDGFPDIVRFTPNGWSFQLNHGRFLIPPPLSPQCGVPGNACLNLEAESPLFPGSIPVGGPQTGLTNVFMTDIFREGTTSLILRDPAGSNWYAANRLTSRNCIGHPFCPILPAPNLALVAGDALTPARRDWFVDVNGDGLPDSVSIPRAVFSVAPNPSDGGHPFVAINSGNGFDAPIQIKQGVPVRDGTLAVFDYDGNGTQDFVYTAAEHGAQSDAVAWLPLDMHGDGRTELLQLWDNSNKLGMTVWSPNGNDSYSEAWSSDDMGQGSGALAWVPVDMQGDGKTQIAQVWSDQHQAAMLVWGPNSDDSYSLLWGGDLGQSADNTMQWLPVQMHADGKTQIVQLWNDHNNLGMTVYVPNPDGSYSVGWSSSQLGQGSGAVAWLTVDMHGDGRTEIAQLWSNNHKLSIIVWAPNSDNSFSLAWAGDTNLSTDNTMAWMPVQMHADHKTQIVQLQNNHNNLAMAVLTPNSNSSYSIAWSQANMGQGSGAVAWLPVQMRTAGQSGIAQLWNNQGKLSMLVWAGQSNNSYQLKWGGDTTQPSDAVAWLAAGYIHGLDTRIVQLRNNLTKLALNVWTPHFDGSYSLAWQSSDMGSYLYALLTADDPSKYRTMPLFDGSGYPIRSGWDLQTMDVNGDGLTDLAQVLDGDIHVYQRRGAARDLLTQVLDRGAPTNIDYAPISSRKTYSTTQPPGVIASEGSPTPFSPGSTYVLNRGAWVVASYTVPQAGSLGGNALNRYNYSYSDARMDINGRGWLGFGAVTTTDEQTHATATAAYNNSLMVGSAYPLAHRVGYREAMVTLSDSGRVNIRREITAYDVQSQQDGRYVVVLPKEVQQLEFEGDSIETIGLIRSFDTKLEYDGFGNATSVGRVTGDGYTDDYTAGYQEDPVSWLISAPSGVVNTSQNSGGVSATRTSQFGVDPGTGAIITLTQEPNGTEDTYQKTTLTLDGHGIATGVTLSDKAGAEARTLTLNTDGEDLYPVSVRNALGDTDRFAIHPAYGVMAAHVNANGVQDTLQHDTFGRLRAVKPADGSSLTITGVFPELAITAADGQTVSVLTDPYGNEIERDWLGFNGQTVIALTSYNSLGLASELDGPCFEASLVCSAAGSEQYGYDELGRLIRVVHADGSSRKLTHVNLVTTDYDEMQNQHYVIEDQLGRMAKSVAIGDLGRQIPVTYHYAPFGLVDGLTDPAGNTSATSYDPRGRPIATRDADRGANLIHWNAFGELRDVTDGNGATTSYTRDLLGRVTGLKDKDGTAQFCWDTAPNGIGKMSWARSSDGIKSEFAYDSLSRISSMASVVSGSRYTIGMGYDAVGRLATLSYPALVGQTPFAVTRHFNGYGYLDQLLDANSGASYWKVNTENERGLITSELFGSGLVTTRSYDARGFLRHIATAGSATATQQIDYDYFANGSLKSRTAQLPAASIAEQFTYDPLDRLREWSASAMAGSPPRSTAILDQTFKYDDLGNLQLREVALGTAPTLTYQYGQNGAGPHAATQVNADVYGYDPAGNQTSGPGRTIDYTAYDLPAQIRIGSDRVTFQYDAFRLRTLKQSATGDSTTYVGGLYERRLQQGGVTHVFFVPGVGRVVAQAENPGTGSARVRYLHPDSLGSVQAVTDNGTGNPTGRVDYEPLGRTTHADVPDTAAPNALGSIQRGFTGQAQDPELDLIDMRGRIYDPRLGRFLSADPFLPDPARSESLNRYSYAWNNPLKWTDPSGFQEDPEPADPASGGDPNGLGGGAGMGQLAKSPEDFIPDGAYFDTQLNLWGLDVRGVQPATNDDNGPQAPAVSDNTSLAPSPMPRWMSKDQAKGFMDQADFNRRLGMVRLQNGLNPDTGRPLPPRDPYTAYEKLVFKVGAVARGLLLGMLTAPLGMEELALAAPGEELVVADEAIDVLATDTVGEVPTVPLPNPGENPMTYGTRVHQELPRIIQETNPGATGTYNVAPGLTGPDLANPSGMNATFAEMKSLWGRQGPMLNQAQGWGFDAQTGRYFFYDRSTGQVFEGIIQTEKFPSGAFRDPLMLR